MELGKSILKELPHKGCNDSEGKISNLSPASGTGGGNSGAVISPAAGLGLSAYQSPEGVPEKKGGKK